MEKVSVVIPVYGQWHLAKRNVDALLKYDSEHIAEIIIVDDCSPEKNPYEFDELVQIIQNDSNKGYAGTVNNGLKKAVSNIIILLDSDAYPIAPFIQRVVSIYNKDENVGCIGFGTVDDNGIKTGSYTYEPSLFGLIAGQQLEMRLAIKGNSNILPFSCSVSFRKQCLKEMDYLNEQDFPVLDADLDISMKIHRSRWKLIFEKDIIVSHMGGNSYKINHKRVILFHNSRWMLLRRHGLIQYPLLAKAALSIRFRFELTTFNLLAMASKSNASKYNEKAKGRIFLLENLKNYS